MIRTLIIEDEAPAAQRLELLLSEIDSDIELIDCLDSVSTAIDWFKHNLHPDLVMLDIQLADGLSFDIFKHVNVQSFIIFTTAYDEYAIKAFQLNSLDYLLKPLDKNKLATSIDKYKRFKIATPTLQIEQLLQSMANKTTNFKKRFAISVGTKIKSIETKDIAYFSSIEKNTFLHTLDGRDYPIDFSLDKLATLLNPEDFFRTNRQSIVHYSAINKINILSRSRIQIFVGETEVEVLVSTAKSHNFRKWLDK